MQSDNVILSLIYITKTNEKGKSMDCISVAGFAIFEGRRERCTLNVPTSCFGQAESVMEEFLKSFRQLGDRIEEQPWSKWKRIDFCLDIDPSTKQGAERAEQFAQYFLPYKVEGDDVEMDLNYGVSMGGGSRLMFGSRF